MRSPPLSCSVLALVLAALFGTAPPAAAQGRPPGYAEAERAYGALGTEQRLYYQVMLTAAGYWNAMPNEAFNGRLFKAIQRFEAENGLPVDGAVDAEGIKRLGAASASMLDLWGFRKVWHPTRRVAIWVPLGLGLTTSRNADGVAYVDPRGRLGLDFTTVPNLDARRNYDALVEANLREGATIHFRTYKDGWFVISSTTRDGYDHYLRYHQDGPNVTGFTLRWNNADGNVSGERVAVLMSASLWSHMTGAAFIDPPGGAPQVAARPSAPTAPPAPALPPPAEAAAKPAPAPTPKEKGLTTGTGFFVTTDGAFVTNAHVVEDCRDVRVRPDEGAPLEARVIARDATNDLALLKLAHAPKGVAALRVGARLGEGVAAFGFPHSDILSSGGNFTLGNVTALNGMGDDSRFLQVSAPVQAGNSGGPLLDGHGNLVGVVTGKLNALKVAARGGDLPQNVNFAVKTAMLAAFLDANRVTYAAGAPGAKALDPADLADKARAMSGFVACR